MATVPALYLLARHIAGISVACIVVIMFSLSLWETEMARFARMYAPFQMLFVWYVYFLYKVIVLRESSATRWMYVISSLSVFVYEGAVFLAFLNFLPFIINDRKTNLQEYLPSITILILALFNLIDFRRLGAGSYLPNDVSIDLAGESNLSVLSNLPVKMSTLLFTTLASNVVWMLIFLIPLTVSGMAVWSLIADRWSAQKAQLPLRQTFLFLLFIILALLNLYGLLVCLLVISFLLEWLNLRHFKSRLGLLVCLAIGVTFIFWLCYVIFTDSWQVLLKTHRDTLAERLLMVLIGYPPIYAKILFPWFSTMPVFTVAAAILVLAGLMESIVRDYDGRKAYFLLFAILLGLALVLTVLKQPTQSVRYTFFLYPLVLLVIAMSMNRLAQLIHPARNIYRFYLASFVLAFMVLAEDFDIQHLWTIDSDRATYRVGYNFYRTLQYYIRMDFRSPAKIINDNLKSGDVVISNTPGISYYLEQLDYFYMNYKDSRFQGIVSCNGEKDLWSNANIIYKPERLIDILKNAESTIWLVLKTEIGPIKLRWEELIKIQKIYSRYHIFESVDGNLHLYRIPPKGDRENAEFSPL
jgi:hypothetical protein